MTSGGNPAGKNTHEREAFVDDESVMRYLREHPEFFARHPRLLAELSLPHEAGAAVSLVERQVTLLRERNIDARKRLAQLVEVAHTNDALFEKTRSLTLLLLDARTLDEIDHALDVGLLDSFDADHVACHFVHTTGEPDDRNVDGPRGASSRRRHVVAHRDVASLPLAQTLRSDNGVTCGAIRAEEYHALFCQPTSALTRPAHGCQPASALTRPAHGCLPTGALTHAAHGCLPPGALTHAAHGCVSDGHASAAIVAFTRDGVRGMLAVGSHDPIRFSSDMGPLFVRYVGDVVCRVLHRALAAGHD